MPHRLTKSVELFVRGGKTVVVSALDPVHTERKVGRVSPFSYFAVFAEIERFFVEQIGVIGKERGRLRMRKPVILAVRRLIERLLRIV